MFFCNSAAQHLYSYMRSLGVIKSPDCLKSAQKPIITDSMVVQFVRGELICTNKPHTRKCTIQCFITHVGFCVLTKTDSPSWLIACPTRVSTRKHGKPSGSLLLITGVWLTGSIPSQVSYRQLKIVYIKPDVEPGPGC